MFDALIFLFVQQAEAQGLAKSPYLLGCAHSKGRWGVERNYAKDFRWSDLAAKQEWAEGQYNLGVLYENGHDVMQDELAGELGQVKSQRDPGTIFSVGHGSIGVDRAKELRWLTLAADQGDPDACCFLRNAYRHGLGVESDTQKERSN